MPVLIQRRTRCLGTALRLASSHAPRQGKGQSQPASPHNHRTERPEMQRRGHEHKIRPTSTITSTEGGNSGWFLKMGCIPLLRRHRMRRMGELVVDGGSGIAPVSYGPDDQRGAAYDIASGINAGQRGLESLGVGFQRAPMGKFQLRLVEGAGQVLWVKAKCLDNEVGLHRE